MGAVHQESWLAATLSALQAAEGTGPAAQEAVVAGAGGLGAAAAAAPGPSLPGPNATAILGCAVDTCPPGCLQQESPTSTVPPLYQVIPDELKLDTQGVVHFSGVRAASLPYTLWVR